MKKKAWLRFLSVLLAMIFMCSALTACGEEEKTERVEKEEFEEDDEEDDDDEDEGDDGEDDNFVMGNRVATSFPERDYNKGVMMLYMVGSNLETDYGMASMDLGEIVESGFDTDLMDVYVCTGGAKEWWVDEISDDQITVYKLTTKDINEVKVLEETSMAKASTLTDFIDTVYEDTDADCYSLVLWNHGAGAVVGFGADENNNFDCMSTPDMIKAVTDSELIKNGDYFEWMGFDACLMGMMEVADAFSPYVHYMIASEETEPGFGWDYHFLSNVDSAEDLYGEQVSKYIIDKYADFYDSGVYQTDYVLACYDLTKSANMVNSFEQFIAATQQDLSAGNYSEIAQKRDYTKSFGKVGGVSLYDCVDLYNFAQNFSNTHHEEASTLMNSIDDMVVYMSTNMGRTNGVSFYFPYSNKEYAQEWIDIYETMNFSEGYVYFLREFTGILNGDELTQWQDVQSTVAEQSDVEPGEYCIKLDDEQMKNYARATFTIWERDPEKHDRYMCWFRSTNTVLSPDGTLSADFDNRILYFVNGDGDEIPLPAFETERDEESIYFNAKIVLEKGEGLDFNLQIYNMTLKTDTDYSNPTIVSIKPDSDYSSTNMFVDNVDAELEEGDTILIWPTARRVVFNSDGTAKPVEEWDTTDITGYEFDLVDGYSLEIREQEEPGEYFCLFTIYDTQNNTYNTSPFVGDAQLTEGAYLMNGNSSIATPDHIFVESNNTITMFDYYDNQVIVMNIPSGWEVNSFDSSTYVGLEPDEGTYSLYISSDGMFETYTQYLYDQTMPDEEYYPNYEMTYEEKTIKGYTVYIVTESYDSSFSDSRITNVSVALPYLDMYGDQKYVTIECAEFDSYTTKQIEDILKELLK